MSPSSPAEAAPRLQAVAQATALFAATIGGLVLAGWLLKIHVLVQLLPGLVAMAPNTAVGFVLGGLALWLQARSGTGARLRAARLFGSLVGLLGLASLAEYVSGRNFGIDELLFRDTSNLTSTFPGRMAVITTIAFIGLSGALLSARSSRAGWTSDALALVPGMMALISLTGYAYGIRTFYWIDVYKGMALHTAVAFLVLAIGVVLSRGERGAFSSLILSDTAGGLVARRVVPVAILVPLLIGGLGLLGQRAKIYGPEVEDALIAVADSALLLVIFVAIALQLHHSEQSRRQSYKALGESEGRYRKLVEFAPIGISRSTPDGRFVSVNAAFARMLGYESPDEMLALDIGRDLYFDPVERQSLIRDLELRGEVTGAEVRMKRRDGSPVWVRTASRSVRGVSGNADYFEGFVHDINENKRSEETRSHLAAIVESSNDAIFSKSLDGMIESWNKAAEKTYGFTAEEVLGRPVAMLAPEGRQHEVPELIQRILRGESVQDFETVRLRKDGQQVFISLRMSPIRGSNGAIVGVSTVAHDETERKKAELYARSLIEASLDPLVTISPEGRITDVNEATIQVSGVPREKLVGTEFSDYFTEPEKAREGYRQVFARGFVTDYPLTLRHADGRLTDVLYNATVYKDAGGDVLGVFAAARDVTERKRAERALSSVQEQLLLAQQAARIGHFAWNIPDNVNEWSEELMALYGLPPGGFGGKYESWRERVFPGDLAEAEAAIQRSLTDGEFFHDYRVVWPDGSIRWLHARAKVFFSEDGKPLRMVGVNMDITERKRAEEAISRLNAELEERVRHRTTQLEAANKELEAFSYSVSHDLRAPLRAIDGFSQILAEDYGERLDADGHHALARIVAGTRAMGQLIDDLLKLSRVSRGEVRNERVDLSAAARDIVAEYRQLEPGRRVEVVIAPGAAVEGDPDLLRVALDNLIGNAFKFTSTKDAARIEFGIERNGKAPVFFVRDNGAGFDPAYAGKLFGAFQRLHTEAEFPGTGIGLATVQRILHRQGGRVWAEGRTGQGATFYFAMEKE